MGARNQLFGNGAFDIRNVGHQSYSKAAAVGTVQSDFPRWRGLMSLPAG
ncbi:hypothetical protein RTCIAT899_PC00065 (plasmid) [Rhizobium tropici CIAT 899]|uniref:Uncharacterized protein n=1 Tax=Rhizobium tropici TaxID=398 RepID=A0ABR6R6K2_RHITR|nr:hypothetical protein RTCIAT899_PC00065 [Rhizobium tropici CIAT 899]MBB4244477.1 hypothetical protein [Rhizobium tropici]MBB5595679.1 hypothetical protein [Rhizobium tropici]MBB6494816.1 hypothetical protein [Rhizobium tropici]